jgi:hypothetical protein
MVPKFTITENSEIMKALKKGAADCVTMAPSLNSCSQEIFEGAAKLVAEISAREREIMKASSRRGTRARPKTMETDSSCISPSMVSSPSNKRVRHIALQRFVVAFKTMPPRDSSELAATLKSEVHLTQNLFAELTNHLSSWDSEVATR